ncbi:MAG TPA: glycosyltransferase [Anaerolineales bacterium]|nr:glycosyltransferase [Anaerolineales bacterium]
MRVLVVGAQQYPMYAPAWARGLREAGVKVITWDWTESLSAGLAGRLERRFLIGPGIARVKKELLHRAAESNAKVVLLYALAAIDAPTVRALARQHWISGYHNDDPFGAYGGKPGLQAWKQALPHFHSHHVFRQRNVAEYRRYGAERVKELRHFFLPWLHRPVTLSQSEKGRYENEIVFVGHAEADARMGYLSALLTARLPVRVHGGSKLWRRHLPFSLKRVFAPIQPVYGQDYVKTIAGAKICLAFFSRANRDDYTTRVFEVPAMGGFLMCERTPVMQELYREDIEAVMFSSEDELVQKCVWYLQHERERQHVAAAGRRRCLSDGHDAVSRMRQWLRDTRDWMDAAGHPGATA